MPHISSRILKVIGFCQHSIVSSSYCTSTWAIQSFSLHIYIENIQSLVIDILFKIQFFPNICYFVNVLVYMQTYMQEVRKIIFFKMWNICIILDSKIFQIIEKICEQFQKMWFFKNAFKLKCSMEVFFDLLIKYRYFYIYNKTNLCLINLIFAFSELWITYYKRNIWWALFYLSMNMVGFILLINEVPYSTMS